MTLKRFASIAAALVMAVGVVGIPEVAQLVGTDIAAEAISFREDEDSGLIYAILDDGTVEVTAPAWATGTADSIIPKSIDGRKVSLIAAEWDPMPHNSNTITILGKDTKILGKSVGYHYIDVKNPDGSYDEELVKIPDFVIRCYRASPAEQYAIDNGFDYELLGVNGKCGENLIWTIDEEGTLTISGEGEMSDFEFNRTPFTETDEIIRNVVIEDGVTYIGAHAFIGNPYLENVTISNSVTKIGTFAFWISPHSKETSLTVTIPDSVRDIDEYAFAYCDGLKSINIPAGVTNIGQFAFLECEDLTTIDVSPDNKNYCSIDGVLYDKGSSTVLCCPGAKTGAVVIPDSVTNISDECFSLCENITSVTIPNGVTNIGELAFFKCKSLTNVVIPDSVTSIGHSAFLSAGLKSVTIPRSVTTIDKEAFGYDYRTRSKIEDFKIYCYKGTAGENYAKDNGFEYELLPEPVPSDPRLEFPVVNKVEWNKQTHQFRMKWNEVKDATQYAIAVKLAGKWKVQITTDKTYFTSPKLRPGSIGEMVICAKINGKWDTRYLNSRAFKVVVK